MMRVLPSLLAVEAMRRGAEPREAAREVKLIATVQYSIVFTYKRKSDGNESKQKNNKNSWPYSAVQTNFGQPPFQKLLTKPANSTKNKRKPSDKNDIFVVKQVSLFFFTYCASNLYAPVRAGLN
jgi:hypothetical protein